jgi:hypothetical protein
METDKITEDKCLEMLSRDGETTAPSTLFSSSVLQLADDLAALKMLFEIKEPPLVSDRVSRLALVVYRFTDASGLGFGDTFIFEDNIEYTIGTWGGDEECESLNYKELRNTVDAIECHTEEGNFDDSMLFFCTDNYTVENALYHGRSKTSRSLHELVVKLKLLEAKHKYHLLVIHVAGEQMTVQLTDEVSMGQLTKGVMNGESRFSFLPMHETPLEQSSMLKNCIIDTMGRDLTFLSPNGWFERGHDHVPCQERPSGMGWDGMGWSLAPHTRYWQICMDPGPNSSSSGS